MFPILLVEDDENDVFFVRRIFRKMDLEHPLLVVSDGQEAINYLAGKGDFADRQKFPIPGLIFLDIKMPRKNGFEVLEWIRQTDTVRRIPVVMTSSSHMQSDVDRAYEFGCNAYFVKPINEAEMATLLRDTANYFSNAARPRLD